MLLELAHDADEFVVGGLVDRLEVGQRHGVADAGDDVFALRVLEVVAVDALVAGSWVAGEGDAGTRLGADVAEDHRDDVDRGAEVGRDALLAAVEPGPIAVPRIENGADGEVELLAGVLRELAAGVVADDALVGLDQGLEVGGVEVEVVLGAPARLQFVEGVLEQLAVGAEHCLAEHREQAAVGVPREPVVAALLREAVHALVVEADVEDGVHHSGHRELRAGPHRDQQRVVGVAEGLAHGLLEAREVLADLVFHLDRRVAALEIGAARLGGDDEAGRHREADIGHLGEVRALAAEKVLHVSVAFAEVVHVLRHWERSSRGDFRCVGSSDPTDGRVVHRPPVLGLVGWRLWLASLKTSWGASCRTLLLSRPLRSLCWLRP